MTVHTVALGLAYLGSAMGVVMVLPQILRIVRHPSMSGVSPWTWAIVAVSCVTWMTYGVRSGSLPQIPGNVLLVSGAIAIVLLVPAAWSRRTRFLGLLAAITAVVLLSSRLSPEEVGFLAFGIGITGMWPQVYETVWVRRGMGPSAVSLTSNAFKVASQLCWLSFALLTTDMPVVVSACMALTTNGIITAVEVSRRRAWQGDDVLVRELATADA